MTEPNEKKVYYINVITESGRHFYAEARNFTYRSEGSLTLYDEDEQPIVVYAPGKWNYTEIVYKSKEEYSE